MSAHMLALLRDATASPLDFDWTLQFQHAPTALALEYWLSRRQGRAMPRREDLDPVAMRKFTQHVGLVEVRPCVWDANVAYFIRRAGSKWEEVYGPITGHYLPEFLPPELEKSWMELFDAVRARKEPVRITSRVDFEGKNWLATEILVAPLGDNDDITMLFLTFVAWSEIAP
jgi:hypothetical protein